MRLARLFQVLGLKQQALMQVAGADAGAGPSAEAPGPRAPPRSWRRGTARRCRRPRRPDSPGRRCTRSDRAHQIWVMPRSTTWPTCPRRWSRSDRCIATRSSGSLSSSHRGLLKPPRQRRDGERGRRRGQRRRHRRRLRCAAADRPVRLRRGERRRGRRVAAAKERLAVARFKGWVLGHLALHGGFQLGRRPGRGSRLPESAGGQYAASACCRASTVCANRIIRIVSLIDNDSIVGPLARILQGSEKELV